MEVKQTEEAILRKFWRNLLALTLLPGALWAGDRHFSYIYESPVLGNGERELESYTTYRFGRDHFFSGLKENLELEMGLGGNIQTSLYLNFDQEMEYDSGSGQVVNSLLFDGVATELKVKLADNVADPIGIGLYLEPEFEPDELDIETKVILDKKMGPWMVAFNLTAESHHDWVDNSLAFDLIPSLGVGTSLSEEFFVGIEAQNLNSYGDPNLVLGTSILSVGPVLSYSGKNWWTNLTVLPQVANLMGGDLDLVNSQRWQIRLANSWSL